MTGMTKVIELLNDYDLSQKYVKITSEMGPSEQLLAFVNFDNSLESEIGLEGFDKLSLEARHEIFMSKIQPDAIWELACEGFLSTLGFHLGFYKKAKEAAETLEKIADADLELKESAADTVVPTFKDIVGDVGLLEALTKLDGEFRDHIPSDLSLDSWEKFHDFTRSEMAPKFEKLSVYRISDREKREGSRFKNSGWDADKLRKAAAETLKGSTALVTNMDKNKAKYDKLNSLIENAKKTEEGSKTLKDISKIFGGSVTGIADNESWADWSEVISSIKKVASCFTIS